ncbi:PREDICTED: OTU domain-containing protein 6A [Condylura cristata]|uniref:OTU domain-containing protein 6A n=1 Tax=Condylura cristata TaxID=143302 RepID=UPI0003347504|nr:PREDICTED: OTU domain-containing protein 6A [Condylura cristata]
MEETQTERQQMVRRHHREKKELQAQIQRMKNAVPKNDKRRRKQLLVDVAHLEAELEQKHQQELEKFQENFPDDSSLDSVAKDLAKMDLENQPPHVTRAQRRRERRVALEQERLERISEAKMEHLASFRHKEEEKLAAILGAKNLQMKDIPADGHCMYRAIQDQLVVTVTLECLRGRTADYLRKHADEFLPFFSNPKNSDGSRLEDFMSYCDDIVHSASWGGQLELRALSHILQTPIEVIQADSPIVLIGEEYTKKPLVLVYLRYACSFGEHYNSVKPLDARAVGGAPPLF